MNWNRANELQGDGFGTSYAYDARGWRVKMDTPTEGGHVRYFVYDANHHLIERLDNNVVTDYVTVAGRPVARIENSVTTYVQSDYQNTPLFETDAAGVVTRAPDYLAYGQPVDAQGLVDSPGYTGAMPGKETGLLYLGARYLHAPRFLSIDPVGLDPTNPSGLNRYAYANNNPARFTDRSGRQAEGRADPREMERDRERLQEILAPKLRPADPLAGWRTPVPTSSSGSVLDEIYQKGREAAQKLLEPFGNDAGQGKASVPYKRPSGATTRAQRASVQGKPCVDCGAVTPRQVADHINPLVVEHYETGSIDKVRMRSIEAVQPQCPTCSARQGAEMSRYSREQKRVLGGE